MNKQKKKDCFIGSAEAFIFYWMIIIAIVPLSVLNFFFCKRNWEHLRET